MDNIKTFTNIDEEDFVGMHHGNKYPLKAGETKPFTEKIALHLAKQLAYKIMAREGKSIDMDKPITNKAKEMLGKLVIPSESKAKRKIIAIKEERAKEEEFEDLKPKKKPAKKKKKK